MTHGPPVPRKNKDHYDEPEFDETPLPVPPDGGWGWVVAFASFMIHIVTDGISYSFGLFHDEFCNYFKESKAYTAWIVSLLVGVTLCSGPISSSFVNRYGCRAVTIAGALLASLCIIVSVFAQNVFTLIITIGIGTGFGFGLIYLPAIVSVTMYFEKYRSLATGIAVCGSGFGTTVFAPLTEYLIKTYGWRGALLIIGGIVLNCMVFGAMFRPLEPPKIKKIKDEEIPLKMKSSLSIHSSNHLDIPENHIPRSQSIGNNMIKKPNGSALIQSSSNGNGMRLTHSQPYLHDTEAEALFKDRMHISSGTMYRPDILYQGSLYNIPQYRSKGELSISHSDRYGSLRRGTNRSEFCQSEEHVCCGCVPCSKETKDTFKEMMDFSLFKDVIFIIFTLSNFCTSIGFNVPYVYISAQATILGLSKEKASYLLAVIGIANTIGRIILGYISDKPWVNRLLVYNICLTTCGIATACSVFCYDFISLAIYGAVFGFTIGAYVGLTSVILVDLLGLERLTNAFGLLLLFQGVASLIGPPIGGWLYDIFASYSPAFLLAGIMIGASGVILFTIPVIQKYLDNKKLNGNNGRVMMTL